MLSGTTRSTSLTVMPLLAAGIHPVVATNAILALSFVASAFTMIQRNVRAKPGSTGVLAVEASFRNDAHWPQPWPTLLLGLSDVDGRLAGQRAFTPGEYRPDQKATDVLLPGQSATVTLEVIEPAPRIVAFTFDFR